MIVHIRSFFFVITCFMFSGFVSAQSSFRDLADAQKLETTSANPNTDKIKEIVTGMVRIEGVTYRMGKYEVTQAQWEAVMGENPSDFKGADNPVEDVSWDDCQEFLKKLNELPAVKEAGLVFRLPTYLEWQYVCCAGATGNFCKLADGTEIETLGALEAVAWFDKNSDERTHPVGQKQPNAFGLYDMHGNVREWCQDIYRDVILPVDLEGWNNIPEGWRVVMGGCWYDSGWDCSPSKVDTSVCRGIPDQGDRRTGFRLCADVRVPHTIIEKIYAGMVSIPGKDYRMGRYEVTQSQWEAVMRENPSEFKNPGNPVENVSWYDCRGFLNTLNEQPAVKESGLKFRLPSVEEWEYACRAGATGKYCNLADGTEIAEDTLGQVAWFEDNSGDKTHPVGQKQPNAFGLYDMYGNVYEWTQTEAAFSSGVIYRGGCWYYSAWDCVSSYGSRESPSYRSSLLGFRLCASGRAD